MVNGEPTMKRIISILFILFLFVLSSSAVLAKGGGGGKGKGGNAAGAVEKSNVDQSPAAVESRIEHSRESLISIWKINGSPG